MRNAAASALAGTSWKQEAKGQVPSKVSSAAIIGGFSSAIVGPSCLR
jgi:hypothetical protein